MDKDKINDTVQAVIILVIISAFWEWLWKKEEGGKPIHILYFLIGCVFVLGVATCNHYQKEQDEIDRQLEECPTCPVFVGDYPDYRCVVNCK